MLQRGGYENKIFYRLGFWPILPHKKPHKKRIWIQAVSVGELSSIKYVLNALLADPNIEIVLSGTTSTGQKIAEQKYSHQVLACGPFPLDWFPFSKLAWSRIKPDMAVTIDSELWPEHIHQAKLNGIPFFTINARLSDRSFSRLKTLNFFKKLLFPDNLTILASSEKQKSRWQEVGMPSDRVHDLGNLKIDISPLSPTSLDKKNFRKKDLGFSASSIVITGISTWPGEEKMLLEILQEMRASNLDARLLIIPRHAERKNDILEIIKAYSFSYQQRSLKKNPNLENIVYLGDTTGELTQLIEAGDIAFLGKTLPPRHEGQNPIEPVAMGLPLVLGPRCTNFQEICDELLTCGAALQGMSTSEVQKIFYDLFKNNEKRKEMSRAGVKWRNAQDSPSKKTARTLLEFL